MLIDVQDLKKYFVSTIGFFKKGVVIRAVDGVNFHIQEGETLGLVGESGCGKTTVGRTMLRLLEPTSGKVLFEGKDIFKIGKKQLQELRKRMAMVFQDPFSSLNPMMTVGTIIGRPIDIHKIKRGQEKQNKILELLKLVGLSPEHMNRYPHEFSGGQRQRIAIARALSHDPSFVVLDEPTAKLDVSVQAQILNLLIDLQEMFALTYLFISHDLSVVRYISDRIAVMYLGKIVESATRKLLQSPKHPYTQALFSAIPEPNPRLKKEKIIMTGDVPSPVNPPSGCRFHPRCPHSMPICVREEPECINIEKDHVVACHLYA